MMFGVDVSKYQDVSHPGGPGVTWAELGRLGCSFAIVRATYGTYRDPSAPTHFKAARSAGMQVGLYHFFRIGQPVTDQLAAFSAQALACGYRVGDIAPALDIEDDGQTGPKVEPSWSEAASVLAAGLLANFGCVILYDTQRDYGRMGKPAWMLEYEQWVAHYTAAANPATPAGRDWAIWQYRVGPFISAANGGTFSADGKSCRFGGPPAGPIDQNRAKYLPVCTRVPGATGSTPPPPDGSGPDHSHDELVNQRLDAMTNVLYAGLDVSHSGRDVSDYEDEEITLTDVPKPNT